LVLPVTDPKVFRFEGIGEELQRPPLAAVRFFAAAGLLVRLSGWRKLAKDARWAMVAAGSRDDIDSHVARVLTNEIPTSAIQLTPARDTSPAEPKPEVERMLGGGDRARRAWSQLRPFERFVLNSLRSNTRLLWRALTEIRGTTPGQTWSGTLARAEVQLRVEGQVRRDVMRLLAQDLLLQGRGLVLAKASGRRAARSAAELFDLHAEAATGVVEIDWVVQVAARVVLWQAHASTVDGEFFPVASLAAATVAATSLCDMLKEFDPDVELRHARLVEEEWVVGAFEMDESTVII
jgi:molybdenum cofactor biosynthesis enzyme